MTQLWAILLTLFAAFLGSFGPIYIKKGTNNFRLNEIYNNYNLFIGFFMYGLSLLSFLVALTGGEVSVLYPIISTSYIWVALLSERKLNEKMNKHKWSGIFLIIVGVLTLTLS